MLRLLYLVENPAEVSTFTRLDDWNFFNLLGAMVFEMSLGERVVVRVCSYSCELYMVSTVPRYISLQGVILFLQVRYDMRGHGRSGKPEADEGYLSQRYAEDYQAVSQAFHLKRPVFVGW